MGKWPVCTFQRMWELLSMERNQLSSQGPGIILTPLRGMDLLFPAYGGKMMSEEQQMVCTRWSICAISFWLRHLLPQTRIKLDGTEKRKSVEYLKKGNYPRLILFSSIKLTFVKPAPTNSIKKPFVKCLPGAICFPDIISS